MLILGIGGVENDAACAVVRDGVLRAAVEEEKLRHQFQPGALPEQSIAACLKAVKAQAGDVGCVAIARPFGHGLHEALRARFPQARIVLVEHHAAHAASAFYLSGFEEATVLTLDREGDSRCGALWKARGAELRLEHEAIYPDSLGELYSRVTAHLGLAPDADEHKVQWMSAAGQPHFKDFFLDLFSTGASHWMRLDLSPLPALDGPPADIAASLQQAVEEWVLALAPSGGDLCLAGGLFFNVMLVAALENSGRWNRVFVQPAAGNSGTALGAACYAWHRTIGRSEPIPFAGLDLGPEFAAEEIKQVVENCKLRFRLLNTSDEVIQRAVALLSEHRILAWMQGRMEFGPRALGNRSILASPLDPYSSENLNEYIKHRDRYRKFAASVPAEHAAEFFDVGANARFLATIGTVKPAHRAAFSSALLDGSRIRVHTVRREDNPLYHRLLAAAGEASGLPVLYNTSFNLFGDPLVCTPRDAVRSFYSSGIDAMFIGNFLLEK